MQVGYPIMLEEKRFKPQGKRGTSRSKRDKEASEGLGVVLPVRKFLSPLKSTN